MGRAMFTLLFQRSYFVLILNLTNTRDEMVIPDYSFKILQGRDITFQPGKRVMINATIDTDADPETFYQIDADARIYIKSGLHDGVVNSFSVVSRSRPDYVTPVHLEPIDYGGSESHLYATALLNSSADVEGIIEPKVSVGFNCSINCLLKEIHSFYSIKVYRDDHEGPFPNGFIGFVHDDYRSPDFTQFYCDLRTEDCTIYCQVVGDHVSTINLYRQQSSADMQTSHYVFVNATGDYWGSAVLTIQNVSMDDAGEYMCAASSQTHRITQMLQLHLVKSPKIDKTLSGVTKLSNGSVSATCIAEGNPAPNVTFELGLDQHQYYIQTTNPTPSVTRTDILIPDPDTASYVYSYSCAARNIENENFMYHMYDYYAMYSPDYSSNYTSY